MDGQAQIRIQLNAPQVLYLWRLAWLCQIAAYVRQQSTEPATPELKPLQGKKSPEQSCTKGKPLATVCCIKGKRLSVRRYTSSVPIFANGAQTAAFAYLYSDALQGQRRRAARAQAASRRSASILDSNENPFALPDGPRIQVADTYGISFNFTGGAAAGGTGGYLFAIDDNFNFRVYRTVGGGALAGASLSFTVDFEVTNALNVNDLAGVASQIGGSVGKALIGEAGSILGSGYKGSYFGFGVGAGTPASGIGFAVDAQPLFP